MRTMPGVRKGKESMDMPVRKAAAAPEGERERLRRPLTERAVAKRKGTRGKS
jgi:hypothetical protein